jgi:simple sugar transport system ATP-binding protein
MSSNGLLSMHAIDKRFPGVHALDRVDFDVRTGEVHGLMGQNGAGKSTLIKVLTGVHPRDGGTITFEGRPFRAASPADAQRKGISTVYQEINLVPSLSVAENLFLGREERRWWGINWRQQRRRAKALLGGFGLDIDVEETLGSYPVAIQQMVAIARAVDTRCRLLILDEPTSSLDARETELLFDLIRRLKGRGLGIVFVTHFLDQVFQISDRITVLRNGLRVGTFEAAKLPKLELVGHMLGRTPQEAAALEAERAAAEAPGAEREPLLSARAVGRRNAIEPFDLQVRPGQVLGLAGLLGSGRTEAARLLFGADRADTGSISVAGKRVRLRTPRHAIAHGLALCPEDRKTDGVFDDLSVRENIALVVQRTLSSLGLVSRAAHARIAERFVRQLDIATPDLERPVKYLSGGNQQKVILARWLAGNPALLILDEPTRGIDVGAKAEIEKLIEQLARRGMAIVFISTELEEVVRRSQRVAVLRDRRKVAELTGDDINEARIMTIIAGDAAADDSPAEGKLT